MGNNFPTLGGTPCGVPQGVPPRKLKSRSYFHRTASRRNYQQLRRMKCACGYEQKPPPPIPAPVTIAPAAEPIEPKYKPGILRRIFTVLLVPPIAVCAVVALKAGNFWLCVAAAAVAFGLLDVAKWLWTGKSVFAGKK